MFYTDKKLQYPAPRGEAEPAVRQVLQQAIGGIEDEIRVCLQYLFQAWGSRGPVEYRDMLMNMATEEMSHIEILATNLLM